MEVVLDMVIGSVIAINIKKRIMKGIVLESHILRLQVRIKEML